MINSYSIFSQIASKIPSNSDALSNTHSYLSQDTYLKSVLAPYLFGAICIIFGILIIVVLSDDSKLSIILGALLVVFGIVLCVVPREYITPRIIYTDYQDAYVHKAKISQIDTPLLINNSNQLSTKINFDNKSIVIYHQTNMIKKHPIVKITKDSVLPYDKTGTQYLKLVNRAYQLTDDSTIQLPVFTTDNNSNLQLSFSTSSKNYKLSFKQQKLIEVILK